ncbi:MAG: serine/threonine-protein kinase, partial [Deltaproteobacteria bacterium]
DITDIGMEGSTPYLVMELLEGEDLQSYLETRGSLGDHEIVELALPIVAALAAAHDRGVVHRDLKPGNIFLARGPDGEIVPKVLDFGVSKLGVAVETTLDSTPFDRLLGSPLYLAPEALNGASNLTAGSDQYSLGVILYQCATGQLPFAGDTLLSLLNAISAGDFRAPSQLRPSLSPALERAILRAMNPNPAQRFAHVRELGSALLELAVLRTQVRWSRSFAPHELEESPSLPTKPRAVRGAVPSALLGMATLAIVLWASFGALHAGVERLEPPALSLPVAIEAGRTRAQGSEMPLTPPPPQALAPPFCEQDPAPLVPEQREPSAEEPSTSSSPSPRGSAAPERPSRGPHVLPGEVPLGVNESPILD